MDIHEGSNIFGWIVLLVNLWIRVFVKKNGLCYEESEPSLLSFFDFFREWKGFFIISTVAASGRLNKVVVVVVFILELLRS